MATYTRADLRNAVLTELGVLDANADPSPNDAVIADDRCQQKLEYLYDQGLIPFDLDSDEIPARFFIPLVGVISIDLVLAYGVSSRAQLLAAKAADGMQSLRRLKEHRYMGSVQRAEYF